MQPLDPPLDAVLTNYSEGARRVVAVAGQEAERHSQASVGIGHIMWGLAHEEESVVGQVLTILDISPDSVRAQAERIYGHGHRAGAEASREPLLRDLRFTVPAEAVLRQSAREALQLGHSFVGTGHILLTLIRQGGEAAQGLSHVGADLGRVLGPVMRLHDQDEISRHARLSGAGNG